MRGLSHNPPIPVLASSGVKARSTLGYSPDPGPGRLEGARSTMAYGPDHPHELPGAGSTVGHASDAPAARSTMAYSPDPAPRPARGRTPPGVRPAAQSGARSTALAYRAGQEADDEVATRVASKAAALEASGVSLNRERAKPVSVAPRPFADTVASSPGEDEDPGTSLPLEEPVESAPQPGRSMSPPAVPDLVLPSRPSRTSQRAGRAPSTPADAPRLRAAASDPARPAPALAVRPIAPAVAAMRAGTSTKPAPDEGTSVEPVMVRRLVGAAVAVAVGAGASSVVGAGLGPVVPAVLAAAAWIGAALLWRQADGPAVRLSAFALGVVGVASAAGAIPTLIGPAGVLAVVASGAAAVVALGFSLAGASMVRDELERHMPQGILVVLMVLLGVAATAQLGRRAATAMEAPPPETSQ